MTRDQHQIHSKQMYPKQMYPKQLKKEPRT